MATCYNGVKFSLVNLRDILYWFNIFNSLLTILNLLAVIFADLPFERNVLMADKWTPFTSFASQFFSGFFPFLNFVFLEKDMSNETH